MRYELDRDLWERYVDAGARLTGATYAGVRVRDWAADMRMALPTFYRSYGSKAGFARELRDACSLRLSEHMSRAYLRGLGRPEAPDFGGGLHALFHAVVHFAVQAPGLFFFNFLHWHPEDWHDENPEEVRECLARVELEALLELGVAQGALRPAPVPMLSSLVWGAVFELLRGTFQLCAGVTERDIDEAFWTLWVGICAEEVSPSGSPGPGDGGGGEPSRGGDRTVDAPVLGDTPPLSDVSALGDVPALGDAGALGHAPMLRALQAVQSRDVVASRTSELSRRRLAAACAHAASTARHLATRATVTFSGRHRPLFAVLALVYNRSRSWTWSGPALAHGAGRREARERDGRDDAAQALDGARPAGGAGGPGGPLLGTQGLRRSRGHAARTRAPGRGPCICSSRAPGRGRARTAATARSAR